MNNWVVICNNSIFNVIDHFSNQSTIIWKQMNNVEVGDYVFMYLSAPFSSIKYICKVTEVNIRNKSRILPFYLSIKPENRNESNETYQNYMELKMVREFNEPYALTRKVLLEHGMKSFQKSAKAPIGFAEYLSSFVDDIEV